MAAMACSSRRRARVSGASVAHASRVVSTENRGERENVVAVAAVTAAGVPGVVALMAIRLRLQTATPDATFGRVSAAFYTSDAVAAVAGALIAAAVAGALIAAAVVALTGLGTALSLFSAAAVLRRGGVHSASTRRF